MYQLYRPPAHLQHMIRYYWLLDLRTNGKSLTEGMYAYPYVNWVFTLGTPYTVSDRMSDPVIVKDTRILGPRTHYADYLHPKGNMAFGVTFQFGATLPIFKEETELLINKIIPQQDILPAAQWLTPYFRDTPLELFIGKIGEYIENSYSDTMDRKGHSIWRQFLELLLDGSHFSASTASISKKLRISQRQLQRITKRYAGLAPKQVQSMLRCRMAIRQIQRTGVISDFFNYGYYDQNHFIKEVKRWTGQTPRILLSIG